MTRRIDRIPASGAQHEIGSGPHRVVVTEVGATLRRFSIDSNDVIDGFGTDEPAPAGRGQVLAPWPNRLEDGSYAFDGIAGRAGLDEPERANAIHGLVRWLPWSETSRSADAIELTCVLHPQPAYPWRLELGVEYRLDEGGLTVSAWARNASGRAAPFGIGFHPYVTIGGLIDDALVTIPAARRLLTDDRGLPIGDEPVEGTRFDLRGNRTVGAERLDTGFTGLTRDPDGFARARVRGPRQGREVAVWVDEAFGYFMVYTGDTLEPASRRRLAIAIEPMTCPPNALRSGTDLTRLEPGQTWQGRWGIGVEAQAGEITADE